MQVFAFAHAGNSDTAPYLLDPRCKNRYLIHPSKKQLAKLAPPKIFARVHWIRLPPDSKPPL